MLYYLCKQLCYHSKHAALTTTALSATQLRELVMALYHVPSMQCLPHASHPVLLFYLEDKKDLQHTVGTINIGSERAKTVNASAWRVCVCACVCVCISHLRIEDQSQDKFLLLGFTGAPLGATHVFVATVGYIFICFGLGQLMIHAG